jgi:hypothetical protein
MIPPSGESLEEVIMDEGFVFLRRNPQFGELHEDLAGNVILFHRDLPPFLYIVFP